jgi:rubrerythrin
MAFQNPIVGMKPGRPLSTDEIIRAVRLDLASEEEAISTYMTQVDSTDDILAQLVLTAIADEERVHVGELHMLLNNLTNGKEADLNEEGMNEVRKIADKAQIIL